MDPSSSASATASSRLAPPPAIYPCGTLVSQLVTECLHHEVWWELN